jgi:hypothetical protein
MQSELVKQALMQKIAMNLIEHAILGAGAHGVLGGVVGGLAGGMTSEDGFWEGAKAGVGPGAALGALHGAISQPLKQHLYGKLNKAHPKVDDPKYAEKLKSLDRKFGLGLATQVLGSTALGASVNKPKHDPNEIKLDLSDRYS